MNLDDIINSMTLEVYQRLSTAVELGKWPDGVTLTEEQKENCLQLVMLWQARHNTEAQHMTIDTNGQMVIVGYPLYNRGKKGINHLLKHGNRLC